MAKYLLLKHYRGAPAAVNDAPMDQWAPEEVSDHVQFMNDWAARLEETGEFIDGQALAPEGLWVRYDGEGRPPVTDGLDLKPVERRTFLRYGPVRRDQGPRRGMDDHRRREPGAGGRAGRRAVGGAWGWRAADSRVAGVASVPRRSLTGDRVSSW